LGNQQKNQLKKMCETCTHTIQVNASRTRQNAYDPTRTTTLRNIFVRESDRRFEVIVKAVIKAVDEEDVFALQILQQTPGNRAYAFLSDPAKLDEFLRWFEDLVNKDLLEVYGIPSGTSLRKWLDKYLKEAYARGITRAREELRKAGYSVPMIAASGGLPAIMAAPIHVDTLAMLYTRTFNDLVGITDAMRQHIARLIAEGFMAGTNPRVLARRLVAAINGKGIGELGIFDKLGRFIPAKRRAEILARTEIIRAHHYANVMEYKSWGVYGVSVMAEFSTAGDHRVCSICEGLEGQIFTLDEILPMIPRHPQCRCIAKPIVKPLNEIGG
jgi:SPP1 gp7 family putative phage head morphogenesis protein